MSSFNSPPSTTTSTTASTHDSPQSVFANDKEMDTNNDSLSFLNGLVSMDTIGNGSEQQTATADAMNMDFGFAPVNSTPYTTIASNPLFMSFREPDAVDPMSSQQNRERAASTASSTKPVTPFDFSSPASSSGQVPQVNNSNPTWQDFSMGDMQPFDLTLSNTLDELFGNVYGGHGNTQTAPSPNPNSYDFLTGFAGLKPGSSPSATSSLSPINHQITPPGSTNGECGKKCTKEQMRQYVAADRGSVFAPSAHHANANGSPNPSSSASDTSSVSSTQRPTPEQMDKMANADADDDCNEFPRCKGLQLPKTQKSDKNVEVMRAWRTIRTDPNFKVRAVSNS